MPTPNSRASTLFSPNSSAALKLAFSVIFSIDGSPACVVSRAVPDVGRGGICTVRVSVSGLNWKMTTFGIGPIKSEPYSISAPRIRSQPWLSLLFRLVQHPPRLFRLQARRLDQRS